MVEQADFIHSPLGKAFEKQIKIIEDQGIKQAEALKALKLEESQELEPIEGTFPKKVRTNETDNEIKNGKKNISDPRHTECSNLTKARWA